MEQNTAEQPKRFPFKLWAIVAAISGIQALTSLFINIPGMPMPVYTKVISVISAVIGLAAAIGFWREKRWGLWLFMALLVYWFIREIVTSIVEYYSTGTVTNVGFSIITLVVDTIILSMLWRNRSHFK